MVTGGSGFIGSALIRHLISETSHSVVNLDILTYAGSAGSLDSIADNNRYLFEQIDICAKDELAKAFNVHRPDKVMHLAAESHVDRSITEPAKFIETNIVGTYNLLEIARNYWSGLSSYKKESFRFHHISTDEVYGDLEADEELFTEETAYAPSSPYSASKASSDHLVRAWHRTYGLPTLITNCSNNYGSYQFPEKLIPKIVIHAITGKELPIYGAGDQVRDWLYVEDHVVALLSVLNDGKIGQTYNIGGHNEVSNLDLVHHICDILDKELPLHNDTYRSQIIHVTDRPGHDRRYAINSGKIKQELNWSPTETVQSGLQKTVSWYLNNKNWWLNLDNKTN